MLPTSQLLDAFRAADPAMVAKYAAIGAAAGAILTPAFLYVAMKLNLRRLRTINEASGIPHTPKLYRIYSAFGASLFAILAASQPVLDAAGENEVWIRGALIPIIMIVIGIPFVRALKRLRSGG